MGRVAENVYRCSLYLEKPSNRAVPVAHRNNLLHRPVRGFAWNKEFVTFRSDRATRVPVYFTLWKASQFLVCHSTRCETSLENVIVTRTIKIDWGSMLINCNHENIHVWKTERGMNDYICIIWIFRYQSAVVDVFMENINL